jgi:predicted RNA binding protein YcfA (HicA-like mRNA interferase family)
MAVNYALLRNLTAREIISALIRDGFAWDRGHGFHQIYYHQDGRRVDVTFHAPSDTFAPKTLKSMIERQAHWTEEDLLRLKLFKK